MNWAGVPLQYFIARTDGREERQEVLGLGNVVLDRFSLLDGQMEARSSE